MPKGPINNIPALVQVMAWRRWGDKLLSEPMMASLLTRICITRPQWVKKNIDWVLLVQHSYVVIYVVIYNVRYCKAARINMITLWFSGVLTNISCNHHLTFHIVHVCGATWVFVVGWKLLQYSTFARSFLISDVKSCSSAYRNNDQIPNFSPPD